MESYHELKRMLCKELDEIVKKGELSAGSLDAIDKLTHSIKSLVTIMAMDDDGYSNETRRYSDGEKYSGRRYSRDEGKSRMVKQFERLMNEASTQAERDAIQSALSQLEQM